MAHKKHHHEMMHEHHGDHRDHLRAEHHRHGHRLHHESEMHDHHGMYRHEEDRPKVAPKGHMEHGMGCHDFKKEAMDIAFGQAGKSGCEADYRKIKAQEMHYHDDSNSGY